MNGPLRDQFGDAYSASRCLGLVYRICDPESLLHPGGKRIQPSDGQRYAWGSQMTRGISRSVLR